MKSYLKGAPCGYFSFNEESILLEVNDTLCRLTGFPEAELENKKVDSIFTLPTRIFYQTHLFPLLRMKGHADEIFITLLRKDGGTVPVITSATKTETEGTILYQCAFISVPNRKRFEDELVAARNKAQMALEENTGLQQIRSELQRQAATLDEQLSLVKKQHQELIQLNRVVTHEMQEPLRKIALFSELLTRDKSESFDNASTKKRLDNATRQMHTVVSGLQQFFWLQESGVKFSQVDLLRSVNEAATAVKEHHGNHSISIHAESPGVIHADPAQMNTLFKEIFENSVRFAKKGENATVRITSTEIKRNTFRSIQGLYNYETYLKIDISDNGTGFEPQYAPRLFDLFVRLQVTTQGRGIGLALCKKIVDNHGGVITIEGRPEQGATVTILLPIRHA